MVPTMQLGSKALSTKRGSNRSSKYWQRRVRHTPRVSAGIAKHDIVPLHKEQQINPNSLLWNRSLLLLSVGKLLHWAYRRGKKKHSSVSAGSEWRREREENHWEDVSGMNNWIHTIPGGSTTMCINYRKLYSSEHQRILPWKKLILYSP